MWFWPGDEWLWVTTWELYQRKECLVYHRPTQEWQIENEIPGTKYEDYPYRFERLSEEDQNIVLSSVEVIRLGLGE